MSLLCLEFDLKKHEILFGDSIKSAHGLQQIRWSGNPFLIIGKIPSSFIVKETKDKRKQS